MEAPSTQSRRNHPRTGLCFLFSGERRHPQGLEEKASSMCCCHTPRASRGQEGGGAKGTLARGEVATSSQATPPIGMRPEHTMRFLEDRGPQVFAATGALPPSNLTLSSNTLHSVTRKLNAQPQQPTL